MNESKQVPIMPKEFIGKEQKGCGYTKTKPRIWTKEELNWIEKLKKEGFSLKEIAQSIGRTQVSLAIKLKRLNKNNNNYNQDHYKEKYALNKEFFQMIKPTTILDLYCGEKNYYKEYGSISNDINENIAAQFHKDAFKLICKLYYEDKKFDLIDLDPFGSAYDCFDLAIKMAKKGLIITLGELGHKRFKRLDFVKSHYDINSFEEFTIDNIIKSIQKIGLRNHKELKVEIKREWKNIGRVYFSINKKKITEQWSDLNEDN